LALEGEGITWMGQPSRQGIALFSVRTEFWRSTPARNKPSATSQPFRRLLRIKVELEWGTILSAWLGTILNRKLHIVAFALVLGFTLFAAQEIETFDDALADNDEAVLYFSIVAPCAKEPPEPSHSRLFRLAVPSLSPLPLLMAPVKAGRDLLNLLTLQKK
jgi:hypothetical protein